MSVKTSENCGPRTVIQQDKQQEKKKDLIDDSLPPLPLYAPKTKKLSPNEVRDLLQKAKTDNCTITEVMKWLESPQWYEDLLRETPTNTRQQWKNTAPEVDVNKMITSDIIEKVSPLCPPSKAFVKISTVPEKTKSRRRLTLETREINRAIKLKGKKVLQKIILPRQNDIEKFVASYAKVDSFDFRSFFYQITLAEAVRPYFRVFLNGDLYQLKVLPMGASFSVFVAQVIALASAELLRGKEKSVDESFSEAVLVYVDNIFFFHNEVQVKRDTHHLLLPEIGEVEIGVSTTRILGRMVDLSAKTVSLTADMKEKLSSFRDSWESPISFRKFLCVWGTVIFASTVLHLPLHCFSREFKTLASLCSLFVRGELDLDEKLPKWGQIRKGLAALTNQDWDSVVVTPSYSMKPKCTLFTDASNDGGGAVLLTEDRIEIECFSFDDFPLNHINEKEAYAAMRSIKNTCKKEKKILWMTDSRVLFFAVKNGRSKNETINECVKEILETNAWIQVRWIPSAENLADGPSRGRPPTREEEVKARINYFGQPAALDGWDDLLYYSRAWRGGVSSPLKSSQ